MKTILLDIGSSTIKAYLFNGKKLSPLKQTSVHFKKNFSNGNISHSDVNTLIKFIKSIKISNPDSLVKTYATSVFRDLDESNKHELIEEVFSKTGVLFNIIDQTTESFYLQLALTGKYKLRKNLILVNIGGGSTELIIIKNNIPIERKNIKIGVGTILTKYTKMNDEISGNPIDEVTSFVKRKLPTMNNSTNTAFYTGGELNYMQLTKYPLKPNTLFTDKSHPSIIKLNDFSNKKC